MRLFILVLTLIPVAAFTQHAHHDLLGKISLKDFQQEPHAAWFNKNYQEYVPKAEVTGHLRKENLSAVTIKIVFGSWCGDSKREVPRMAKLLNQIAFPDKNMEWIAVDDSLAVYKQSPQREEAGLGVYRVPTFVVYEKEREIGRIVEYPAESLERDLLNVLQQKKYTPNYFSYPFVQSWLKEGLLTDENVSPRGLAMQLYGHVQYESELNSCGYVLLADNKVKEATTVFRINANLFPQSANCFDSLGEAYAKSNLKEKAIQAYEYALKLDPESENAKEQLRLLKEGK